MGWFPRPVVVTSHCLELAACRYNAQSIRAPFVRALADHVEIRPVCPEVEIGLGVPRDPIRLVAVGGERRLVQPATGRDVTEPMHAFADRFLTDLGDVDGFVLKSRSPSCGIKDTKEYASVEAEQPARRTAGYFGGAVLDRFPYAAVEDEGRLTNSRLRHHFLTKLFAHAQLRSVRAVGVAAELVRFHTERKLLLLAYHQTVQRELGRLVAGVGERPFRETVARYEELFGRALAAPSRPKSTINVLLHALGYFKGGLATRERRHFLTLIERYRQNRVTLAAPLAVLQTWIARFDEPYLARQVFFEPYPPALFDLSDSAARGGG